MVDAMTHNGTNAGLAPEVVTAGRPGCGDGERLSGEAQRTKLASILPDLARSVARVPLLSGSVDLFDGTRADDHGIVGVHTVVLEGAAGRRRLVAPERAAVLEAGTALSLLKVDDPALTAGLPAPRLDGDVTVLPVNRYRSGLSGPLRYRWVAAPCSTGAVAGGRACGDATGQSWLES